MMRQIQILIITAASCLLLMQPLSAHEPIILPTPYYNDSLPIIPIGPLVFSGEVMPNPVSDLTLEIDTIYSLKPYTLSEPELPRWLTEAETRTRAILYIRQQLMSGPAHRIDYFAWELPEPPELLPITDAPVLPASRDIPAAIPSVPTLPDRLTRRHWLHTVALGVQFSQAYISPNWYQGGDNNVTLLINTQWSVKLNKVYHPNLLIENNIQYKLGLYSTPNDQYHKYSISEDNFQWNFTGGLKAFKKWYYSFNLQFKTQFLNNYAANSYDRKASFLSPGELNLGLGMTYSTLNKKRGLKFQTSIAPLSYNLRTCIDPQVDPTQFNIKTGRKTANEVGSNADITMTWQLTGNILWSSRIFLFTDYKYFAGDWENTFSFTINRFLSTQIYIHGRYDTSAGNNTKGWKRWMLKEILSFGFAYNFSTIPPKK